MFDCDFVTVTYTAYTEESGYEPSDKREFIFEADSHEFEELKNILTSYSYRFTMEAYTEDAALAMRGDTHLFIIQFGKRFGYANKIVLNETPLFVIDGESNKIGYFGNGKITALNEDLLGLLGIG